VKVKWTICFATRNLLKGLMCYMPTECIHGKLAIEISCITNLQEGHEYGNKGGERYRLAGTQRTWCCFRLPMCTHTSNSGLKTFQSPVYSACRWVSRISTCLVIQMNIASLWMPGANQH
jgi:hypothetical protein